MPSHRLVAADLNPPHQPAKPPGVAQRDVLGAAVVPEGDRAVLPAEAEGEFRPVAELDQEIEQRPALRLGHALKAHRVGRVDEQHLAAGLGMSAHHRMHAARLAPVRAVAVPGRAALVLPGLRAGHHDVAVHGAEPAQHPLHAVRQRVVGEVLVGEHGVAAIGRNIDAVEDGAHRRPRSPPQGHIVVSACQSSPT
jgi:hypothetical protein